MIRAKEAVLALYASSYKVRTSVMLIVHSALCVYLYEI